MYKAIVYHTRTYSRINCLRETFLLFYNLFVQEVKYGVIHFWLNVTSFAGCVDDDDDVKGIILVAIIFYASHKIFLHGFL